MGLVPVDTTRFEMPPPGSEAQVGSRFRRYETVAAWVVALNDFLRRGLADHTKSQKVMSIVPKKPMTCPRI